MSERSVYLVPVDEPSPRMRDVRDRVVAFLKRRGVIDEFYDKSLGWYAAGSRSADLVCNIAGDDPAFEYAIVYDRKEAHFVPDSHSGDFGANCLHCQADLDPTLYDMLEEQGDLDDAQDMADYSVTCPSCNRPNSLRILNSEIDTALTRFFINFCCVDTFDLNAEIISELERIVDAKLRIIPERL